jgi:hypothetical protein
LKTLSLILASILLALSARAQTGRPQELACTERAFNFSFSLGLKWKMTAAKMGPVESRGYVAENGMLWGIRPVLQQEPPLLKFPAFLTAKPKPILPADAAPPGRQSD